MLNESGRCSKCGKMFATRPGKTMCARCESQFAENLQRVKEAAQLHAKRTTEEIAAYAGLSIEEVQLIMQDPQFDQTETSDGPPCARCKERPAQRYSEYCLTCRLELNKAFGHAARTLASQIEREVSDRRAVERIKQASVLKAVDKKRAGNPMRRLGSGSPNRYSQP